MLSALAAEHVRNAGNSGSLSSKLTGRIVGTALATFGFETNGDQTGANATDSMRQDSSAGGVTTTLIWDGSTYLGGKQ